MMKRALLGMLLAVGMLSAAPAFAKGEARHQAPAKARVQQDLASGRIDQREAHRLSRDAHHVKALKHEARADGVVTKKEHRKIHAAKLQAERDLARAERS